MIDIHFSSIAAGKRFHYMHADNHNSSYTTQPVENFIMAFGIGENRAYCVCIHMQSFTAIYMLQALCKK